MSNEPLIPAKRRRRPVSRGEGVLSVITGRATVLKAILRESCECCQAKVELKLDEPANLGSRSVCTSMIRPWKRARLLCGHTHNNCSHPKLSLSSAGRRRADGGTREGVTPMNARWRRPVGVGGEGVYLQWGEEIAASNKTALSHFGREFGDRKRGERRQVFIGFEGFSRQSQNVGETC